MLRQADAEPTVEIEGAEKPSRRGFLKTLTKVAFGIVAGLAHLSRGSSYALFHVVCCWLAKAPSNGQCAYNCWRYSAQGYHGKSWICTQGSTSYYCFECTKGIDCWHGEFLCSDYAPA